MTHFEIAFGQLSQNERNILQQKILEWELSEGWKSRRVVENFKGEHFLPIDQMTILMKCIIALNDKSFDDIKNALQNLIYNKHQLQGDNIKQQPYPETAGFAVSIGDYKDFLMRLYGKNYFDDDESELDKFINNCTQGIYDSWYADFLFKDDFKLIWLTWDTEKDINNPFCFMQFNKAEEIINILGLDTGRVTAPLLLFFTDVKGINDTEFGMFRPTFCDADFYYNFRPTPVEFKDYGLTQPLGSSDPYDKNRRPETVVKSKYLTLKNIKKVVYI